MKHLSPLRTLRLLTALSAVPSPVYVPLIVGLATPMVSISTVVAQSQTSGVLPPLPPAPAAQTQSASSPTSSSKEKGLGQTSDAQAAPTLLPPISSSGGQPAGLPPLPNQVASAPATPNPKRDRAVSLTTQAKLVLDRGDITTARRLIDEAKSLNVADTDYAPGQMRPWQVELALKSREMLAANAGVVPATATQPANGVPEGLPPVQSGVYQPQKDGSRVAPASGVLTSYDADSNGQDLFKEGMNALAAGNQEAAVAKFKAAWEKKGDLDPPTLAQLKDKLNSLRATQQSSGAPDRVQGLAVANQEEQKKRQRLFAEVTGEVAEAEKLAMQNKPLEALDKLRTLRQRVSQSEVDSNYRMNMLTMVDRVNGNIEEWVKQNKAAIQLDQTNKQIEDRMRVEADDLVSTDQKVASLVDQYNQMILDRRFEEAVEVARNVSKLLPGSEIATTMMARAKLQAANSEYELTREQKEYGFTKSMASAELSSIPFDDTKPLVFGSLKDWNELSKNRLKNVGDMRILPSERKIWQALEEPFSGNFDKRPLADVMKTISEMYGIPIDVDERSINEEGLSIDQPISLDLQSNSIKLKSALTLVLDKLNLKYVVKNETLTIQSKRFTQPELITRTYSVKDLVIPIPNFVTDYNTGMAGALQAAYQAQTSFASASVRSQGQQSALAATRAVSVDPKSEILTQPAMAGFMGGAGWGGANQPMSPSILANGMPGGYSGVPQGFGGSPLANFTELIQLIETVVTPDAWQSNSGTSSMIQHNQTLSLLVRAPQETHEALADLLKSLRALQNLQVTIEVRFIQLQDSFFERIGIDFDIRKDDNIRRLPNDDDGPAVAVGITSGRPTTGPASFTDDLDIAVNNNFSVSPPFGNPDINQATQFGIAILSDLELFFFLEASSGNSRQNVLNAPKVTMFDGQIASINDFAQRPFVISFEPVVADFAVAQRPIIVVLNEGTQMNVQSVVSQDRRFVRMTLVPQFTRLEAADRQFTFSGRRSSNTGTSILNPNGTPSNNRNNEQQVVEGTTVQQPTLGQTSVQTTVNVPDGGTILLGGIKRLSEGRVERGTPILSKIPYLNRLFKNNAIGRETTTLMLTVSPRIIIPEEEEERLTGTSLINP